MSLQGGGAHDGEGIRGTTLIFYAVFGKTTVMSHSLWRQERPPHKRKLIIHVFYNRNRLGFMCLTF